MFFNTVGGYFSFSSTCNFFCPEIFSAPQMPLLGMSRPRWTAPSFYATALNFSDGDRGGGGKSGGGKIEGKRNRKVIEKCWNGRIEYENQVQIL